MINTKQFKIGCLTAGRYLATNYFTKDSVYTVYRNEIGAIVMVTAYQFEKKQGP